MYYQRMLQACLIGLVLGANIHAGETVPFEKALEDAHIEPQPLGEGIEDNGINVLYDFAHDVSFYWMWETRDAIRNAGFRVTGSHATLHTVLTPGELSRMRIQAKHDFEKIVVNPDGTKSHLHRPVVKLPNPEFNVVVTYQFAECQLYMPEEIKALKRFVKQGGGLVAVLGGNIKDTDKYPLGNLARELDAEFINKEIEGLFRVSEHQATAGFRLSDDPEAKSYYFKVSKEWTPVIAGSGNAVVCVRNYGKGRIVFVADQRVTREWLRTAEDRKNGKWPAANFDWINAMIKWAAGGKEPIGGSREVPWEKCGVGGAILPENVTEVAGVTLQYASNQMPGVMDCVVNRTKEVKDLLDKWLPSPPRSADEFYLTPVAGTSGSGWAINVYTPRSAAVCANDNNLNGLLSVMAHEFAHTMTGPAASNGTSGGVFPDHARLQLFSEAHAGYFQTKVEVALGMRCIRPGLSGLARVDPLMNEIDLTEIPRDKVGAWGWTKLWFIWEMFEYRYGEMWYSNWMKTIHETYKDDPEHIMTWQEVVMTMSESVGEDLFPFMKSLGTSVKPPPGWDMPPMKMR